MAKLIVLRGSVGSGKTAVANQMRSIVPALVIVEADDIKLSRYGTTVRCEPSSVFPETGSKARRYLDQGIDVVVVEPFVERSHYLLMLQGANLSEEDPGVMPIWLNCTVNTALKRKVGVLNERIIREQFQRYVGRHQPINELVLDTDDQQAMSIAAMICAHARLAA